MDKFLDRNASVRVLAIALALLLWFLGMNQQNPIVQRSLAVPVQYGQVGPELALVSVAPRSIIITVEGRVSVLDGLSDSDFVAVADLTRVLSGVSQVPVEVTWARQSGFTWGRGALQIVEHEPRTVEVNVDEIETRRIDVDIRVVGNPHPDYVADTLQLSTATVAVTAPSATLQTVHRLSGALEIEGAQDTVTRMVALRPVDFGGREVRGVQLEMTEIEATVPVHTRPPAATIAVNTALTGSPEAGFRVVRVVVEPQLVTVRAPSDRIEAITALATRPISVAGRSSTFSQTVALVVPPEVVWQSHQEVKVTVIIEPDLIEHTLLGIPVRPQNLPSGFNWSMEPSAVDVRLKGRRDLIDKVTEGMLDATINAQGLGQGAHQLRVTVVVPDGLQYEVRPMSISLTLQERN